MKFLIVYLAIWIVFSFAWSIYQYNKSKKNSEGSWHWDNKSSNWVFSKPEDNKGNTPLIILASLTWPIIFIFVPIYVIFFKIKNHFSGKNNRK
jgi:heme/copper-type cytochrome/quinol oxidase subunit 2